MKKESDMIFYSIVIFGIVGIIIVIAAFFITMPEKESYTELYFNLPHKLPDKLNPGDEAIVHWSVANHENKDESYRYRVLAEEYKIYPQTEETFRCYSKYLPKKVDEKRETSYYKTVKFSKEDVCGDECEEMGLSGSIYAVNSTRAIEQNYSSSPIMYEEYSIRYNARVINGSGQHLLSFLGRTGYRKWALFLDPMANKSIFIGNNGQTKISDIEWNQSRSNYVVVRLRPGKGNVLLNNNSIISIEELWDYTDGIITLDIINSSINLFPFDIVDEEENQEKPREIVKYNIVKPVRRVKSNKTTEVEYVSSLPAEFVEYKPHVWRFFNSSGISAQQYGNDIIPSSRIMTSRIPDAWTENSFSFSYVALDGKRIVRAGFVDSNFDPIYFLEIDEMRDEIKLLIFEDSGIVGYQQTANVSDGEWHRIDIVNKDSLMIRFNSRTIFNITKIDNTGAYSYLHTDKTYAHFSGISLRNLKDSEPIEETVFSKVLIVDEDECQKRLIDYHVIDEGTLEVPDHERTVSKFILSPENEYQFIRVKVELTDKDQDIMFWI